jgi:hypothetical protein
MKRTILLTSTVVLAGVLFLDTPARGIPAIFLGGPTWQLEELACGEMTGNIPGSNFIPVRSENSYIFCKGSSGDPVLFVIVFENDDGMTRVENGSNAGTSGILKAVLMGTNR